MMSGLLNFFVTVFLRWLAAARRLCADTRAAYTRDGLRAACFEFELRARTAHALALSAPLIFNELLDLTVESEGLRAAMRDGIAPETYVRRKCELLGVPVGSPTFNAMLTWAWQIRNYSEARGDAS